MKLNANDNQISNHLKLPNLVQALLSPSHHHKPDPGRNHNQAGHSIKPFPGSVADTVHHLPDKNQRRGGADTEEHHHQGTLEHSGKGMMSLHGGSCGGEEGGVGEAAGEKAEDDAHRVVCADGAWGLEECHDFLHE